MTVKWLPDNAKAGEAGPWNVVTPGQERETQKDEDRRREEAAGPQAGDKVG